MRHYVVRQAAVMLNLCSTLRFLVVVRVGRVSGHTVTCLVSVLLLQVVFCDAGW
jgi:hypothetical protein